MTAQRAAWWLTVWGEGVIELSKVATVDEKNILWTRSNAWPQAHILVKISLFYFYFLSPILPPEPRFLSLLSSALLLDFHQHIGSLRCANPFDIGWIDSCWQNAPCHFVCCHLIGAPQFAFPFPFSYLRSLWPGFDIKGEVICPFK